MSNKKKILSNKFKFQLDKYTFMDWLGSFGSENIGVDLGTSNMVVYLKEKGIIFSESSVVAKQENKNDFFSYGTKTEEMEGRTPQGINLIYPVRNSVVVDYRAVTYLLNSIMSYSYLKGLFFHPRLLICVPPGISKVQKRALLEASVAMGVRKTVLIDQPIATLMGIKNKRKDCQGFFLIDFGGGSVKISVLSKRGIVISDSLKYGGIYMDQAIISYIRKQYHVNISRKSAESLKITLGVTWELDHAQRTAEVSGQSLDTGLPVRISVTSKDIYQALSSILNKVFLQIINVLQQTPPVLLSDIKNDGIIMSGALSQLKGLSNMIGNITGISTYVINQPSYINAIGAGKALEYMHLFRDSLQDLH